MSKNGTYRIAAAVPNVKPGDVRSNVNEIINCCKEAQTKGSALVLFPELSLTGAGCGDLFGASQLQKDLSAGLRELLAFSASVSLGFVAGFPLYHRGKIFNASAFIYGGRIKGISCKYIVSDPLFTSGAALEGQSITFEECDVLCSGKLIFEAGKLCFAIVAGEDLLTPGNFSPLLAAGGAQVILHPAAFPELAVVSRERMAQLKSASSALTSSIPASFPMSILDFR